MVMRLMRSEDVYGIPYWDEFLKIGILQLLRCLRKQKHCLIRHLIQGIEAWNNYEVLLDHEGYEVTTYRIDGKYEDNRHPKEVTFTRSLKGGSSPS